MEASIYLLCAATALACGLLLLRGYKRRRVALLLWCGLFFLALAGENIILFVDLFVFPETDLSILRNFVALVGVILLLYGLIWETE